MTAEPHDDRHETPAPTPSPSAAGCQRTRADDCAALSSATDELNRMTHSAFHTKAETSEPSPARRFGAIGLGEMVGLGPAEKIEELEASHEMLSHRIEVMEAAMLAQSCPHCMADDWDARDDLGPSEPQSAEWPGLTEALRAMEIETTTEDRVLERLEQITRRIQPRGGARSKKQLKTGAGTLTVDEKLKTLHVIAPDFTEEKPLKEIGALLGCSQSAFDGGDYYENTLKLKREQVRASKSMKRASGPDRRRDENRQVGRDNREHVDSYEDADARIDATWDQRQGGRFLN